ncbi:hypothetical protein WSK_3739 [Novosphingobium sp. Rr 2-17]|uniref:hypothetical protein n=1 Tax=Novosphingobium sp. Rr 2-17 TaxID=555793 RepID=UPI000269825C|nr:hypothetical protein [Novosphingobium sp. Rr 2-17]EIZ77729.1 hypothetical protein WSK_3739 [Novosphingobium sp. Rr 2-17]
MPAPINHSCRARLQRLSALAAIGLTALATVTSSAIAQDAPPPGEAPPGFPAGAPMPKPGSMPPGPMPKGGPMPGGPMPSGPMPGPGSAPGGPPSFDGPPPSAAMAAFRDQLAADVLPADGNWPVPSSDPKNFEGVWRQYNPLLVVRSTDMFGGPTPLNEAGKALLGKRVASAIAGKPNVNASAMCIPPGQPLQMEINLPFVVYQNKDWVQFVFQQYHGAWTAVFDPAKQPDGAARPYTGKSIAHWEGDTLVVETSGFKQPMWLDINGTPASANAKFTHRIRKIQQGTKLGDWILEVITTLDDPAYYTRPWSWATSYSWRPDKAPFAEYDCEYSVNRPDYVSSSGLVPETDQ